MRGEKYPAALICASVGGSPPHARGKAKSDSSSTDSARITPACAGKSYERLLYLPRKRDHPRMRGEKVLFTGLHICNIGSPPHARGKVFHNHITGFVFRITPACAGKSDNRSHSPTA